VPKITIGTVKEIGNVIGEKKISNQIRRSEIQGIIKLI